MAAISTAITAATAAIGLGLQLGGTVTSVSGAQKQSEAQQKILQQEQQAEALRKKAMEMDARRKSLEVVRNQQRARALSLAHATNQGAGLGSGLQGGYGQISGDTNTNLMGIQNALATGRGMFDINAQISQQKIAMSQAGSQMALGSGLTSFGGSLISSLPAVGRLSGFADRSQTGFTGTSGGTGGGLGGLY